jgi:hypothetical protein
MKFIAYFDYLGFSKFIENNSLEYQRKVMGNIFRDIETSMSDGILKQGRTGLLADLSKAKINCLNFSDTVIFWTNDDSVSSLLDLLAVAYSFNWNSVRYFFPVRGVINFGEIEHVIYNETSDANSSYNLNSVYGKGVVDAYYQANLLNWAGTVVDASIIEHLHSIGEKPEDFLSYYAILYQVPYKQPPVLRTEYALRLFQGKLNPTALKNMLTGLEENFNRHGKTINSERGKEILQNTRNYIQFFKE